MTDQTTSADTQKISLGAFITQRQQDLNITDHDLAYAAGYSKPSVFEQIKAGRMNLPFNKVTVVAELLRVSRIHLLGHVLTKSVPDLVPLLADMFPLGELSKTETNLIRHLRGLPGAQTASPLVIGGDGVVALVVPGWSHL